MKRRLFTGIAALAGAALLSFSLPSDNKAPNYNVLKAKIEKEHKHDGGWYPCHPGGDLGPCFHYNAWGYRIHTADVYPCEHICY